ncbi:MAG: MFS transporter [Candidatus Bathyarchaeota archaeon]
MKKGSILFVAALSSFLTSFMASAVNIALPAISGEFGIDVGMLGWIAKAYLLTSAVFLVPFGRIADIYGRKKIFTYGILVFAISSLLLSLSSSSMMLILLRVGQALGAAMTASTVTAILTSVFSLKERGKVLGIYLSAVYLGLSLGPFLGGSLTHFFGWRSIFLSNGLLGLVVIAMMVLKIQEEWRETKGEKFDLVGSILYGVSLTSLIYGLSLLPAIPGVGFTLASGFLFFVFVKWELREKTPILDISLFRRNSTFTLSSVASLISYSATYAISYVLSLYLQYVKGLPPQHAGLVLASQAVTQTLFAPIGGKLSDRFEPRFVASLGLGCMATGLFLLTVLDQGTSLEFIVGILVLVGMGAALFSSPNTNAIMSSVEKRFYGVASGMVGTMRYIGQSFSISITTLILTVYLGQNQITPEYYPNFFTSIHVTFLIMTALSLSALVASLIRGKIR